MNGIFHDLAVFSQPSAIVYDFLKSLLFPQAER
jgi:hypothetical protein